MNILFLAHRIPFPPNKGDKIRSYHLLRYLAARGRVSLGTLVDEPRDIGYVDDLKEFCGNIHAAMIRPRIKKIISAVGQAAGIPASVLYFYNRELQHWVDHLLLADTPDLVFCFSSTMAEYLYRSRQWEAIKAAPVRLLMDFCDVDSLKWLDYGRIKQWPLSAFFHREGTLLQTYEQRIADTFDVCYLASSREKSIFDRGHHANNIRILENGVDLEFFSGLGNPRKNMGSSPTLVFTGAMDYDVNIDGVRWFVRDIWPAIQAALPATRFFIVGSNPVAEVKKLGERDGVIVTGFVDDIREYYRMADVCVAPLRIARGIQNKVLEAMAMSRPVVCTTNAFEGISAQPGHDIVLADRPDDFAFEVLRLLRDDRERERLQTNGRSCMEQNYAWNVQLASLERDLSPSGSVTSKHV